MKAVQIHGHGGVDALRYEDVREPQIQSTGDREFLCAGLKIFGCRFGSRANFRQVLNFVGASEIKPIIDRVFELKNAAQAHQHLEAGKQFGKIVLRIDS